MKNVLYLQSSVFSEEGTSHGLASELLTGLQSAGVEFQSRIRNLAAPAIDHLGGATLKAIATEDKNRDAQQQQLVDLSDQLIAELQGADLVVIAAPMYNFTIPSTLKAWIDHVARAGVTFKYTSKGPSGLLVDKPVVVVATMGTIHQPAVTDFVRPYLKTVLGFLGLTRIEFITADRLAMNQEQKLAGIKAARDRIRDLVPALSRHLANTPVPKEAA